MPCHKACPSCPSKTNILIKNNNTYSYNNNVNFNKATKKKTLTICDAKCFSKGFLEMTGILSYWDSVRLGFCLLAFFS